MMFAEKLLAVLVTWSAVSVRGDECWAENPTHWGNGELVEIIPSQCCFFCHRFYGKCGECRVSNNATGLVSCICDKPLKWKWEDQGACNPDDANYIPDCRRHCKALGHPKGECQFTWKTLIWFHRLQCMCRVADDSQTPQE